MLVLQQGLDAGYTVASVKAYPLRERSFPKMVTVSSSSGSNGTAFTARYGHPRQPRQEAHHRNVFVKHSWQLTPPTGCVATVCAEGEAVMQATRRPATA